MSYPPFMHDDPLTITRREGLSGLAAGVGLALTGCATSAGAATPSFDDEALAAVRRDFDRPRAGASRAFWAHWGDGKAELSGYRMTAMRYGEPREAELVLITVTEALKRSTLIKDDTAPEAERLHVIKLNSSLKFMTGIYPYSVLTSVFAPVADYGRERFAPAKIAMTAQEWCGTVFQQLKVARTTAFDTIYSYFDGEGEAKMRRPVPEGAVFEDALPLQLRELDAPFLGAAPVAKVAFMPSLWRIRKAHVALGAIEATIRRSTANVGSQPVVRFVVSAGALELRYEIEQAAPRRLLSFTTSDGESATLLKTARLPYWALNDAGGSAARAQLGLQP